MRWYLSQPVPPSDQPWYVNAVALVETRLDPAALLAALLAIEDRFGAGAARLTPLGPLISTCSITLVANPRPSTSRCRIRACTSAASSSPRLPKSRRTGGIRGWP